MKSTVYSLCLLTLAATGCLEAPPPATRATAQPISSGLSFERLGGSHVAGTFVDRDTAIEFDSHVDALVTARLALPHGTVPIHSRPPAPAAAAPAAPPCRSTPRTASITICA